MPDDLNALSSRGLGLAKQGKTAEAVEVFQQAVASYPNSPELHLNLAGLLMRLKRDSEAELSFRKAVSLAPSHPLPTLELAKFLMTRDRLDEAKSLLKNAEAMVRVDTRHSQAERQKRASLAPIGRQVVERLGELLARQGRTLEALGYLQEAVELGAPKSIEVLFANCISRVRLTKPMPGLKPLLTRAFQELWIAPADLVGVASRALFLEPAFDGAWRKLEDDDSVSADFFSDDVVKNTISDPLLLEILNTAIVTDYSLEQLLTRLRLRLLHLVETPDAAKEKARVPALKFCVALANQCFANEYVYTETPAEREIVARLERRVADAVKNDEAVNPLDICVLASYRPLHQLSFAEQILSRDWPQDIRAIIKRQIGEPFEERELQKSIPQSSAIKDAISIAVKNQYEESPYPRWIKAPPAYNRQSLAAWLRDHLPGPLPNTIPEGRFDMLVAGCGTGQELIGFAQTFESAEIEGVDLSLSSLAYAARKISEMGLRGIALRQADILELDPQGRQYDIIACSGVLHHLAEPLEGWRILASLTKPGGYMFVALYSELGRQDITALCEYAREGKYGRSPCELRRFRQDILALPADTPVRKYALNREDFYNLSMLRDMVFHVNEHRFTIEKIRDAIKILGLEFCGFVVEPELQLSFENRFGKPSQLDPLEAWSAFELEHPQIFRQMYHFIVRRPATGAK